MSCETTTTIEKDTVLDSQPSSTFGGGIVVIGSINGLSFSGIVEFAS